MIFDHSNGVNDLKSIESNYGYQKSKVIRALNEKIIKVKSKNYPTFFTILKPKVADLELVRCKNDLN
ncbi:MAG: hypothetical protein IPG53_07145 [Ignavibacteriales bacterium]|nr:hypothetical protein [Ignavibacteriales bacterium]